MAVAQTESKITQGALLVGKYRVVREIGRGGMATVYECEHIGLGKKVAVKVLAQELANSAIVIERFFREARAAASVKSPYIVDVYDSGRLDDGRPFIAMELLEGESLYDRMARVRLIDPATTVKVIHQCAKGLMKAHASGIVHRDLKPENIHLSHTEEGEEIAKILDFGLAKFYAPVRGDEKTARLTREGAVFGTPAYMSPEQVKGQGSVDHRADLWALGCMAFECLTGRPVWNTDQGVAMTFAAIAAASPPVPSRLRPDLPPTFDEWFRKALERDPNKRFQTAAELADALARAFNSAPISLVTLGPEAKLDLEAMAQELPSEIITLESERPPPNHPMLSSSTGAGSGDVPPRRPNLSATDLPPTAGPDSPPPSRTPGSPSVGRFVFTALALGAAAAGGYFLWTVVRPQPGPTTNPTSSTAMLAPDASAAPQGSTDPKINEVEERAWETSLAEGQRLLGQGDSEAALKKFKDAADQGGGHVARSFVDHVKIATGTNAPCKLVGFAHPRVGYGGNVSRPTVAVTSKGAVVAWTDDHEQPQHEHVWSAQIDPNGHALVKPRDLTPEADSVPRASLLSVDEKVVLLYWDKAGQQAGVRVRWLDEDGRLGSPSTLITATKSAAFWPTIDRAPDGFWVGWVEDKDKLGDDLYLRKLGHDLGPVAGEIRATDHVFEKGKGSEVHDPSLAIGHGTMIIAYGLERDKGAPLQQRIIQRMRLPLNLPELATGLEDKPPAPPVPGGGQLARKDRELGDVALVNEDKADSLYPSAACGKDGCYIVWHGARGGAYAAAIDPANGLVIWRKKFAPNGGHPSIASNADGQVEVAYYEGGKIRIATLSRDGVGTTTTFGRITPPDMPRPWIAAGRTKGEWYVAWLDVEAMKNEAFVARLSCRN